MKKKFISTSEKKISWFYTYFFLFLVSMLSTNCKKPTPTFEKISRSTKTKPKGATRAKKKANSPKTKDLIQVKNVNNSSHTHYCTITLHPPSKQANLDDYQIVATTPKGILYAAKEKISNKFAYTVDLQTPQPLTGICYSKGNVDDFSQGKCITFKCFYQPAEGSLEGENHQLKIIVLKKDKNNNLIQQKEVLFEICIKNDIEKTENEPAKPKNKKNNKSNL